MTFVAMEFNLYPQTFKFLIFIQTFDFQVHLNIYICFPTTNVGSFQISIYTTGWSEVNLSQLNSNKLNSTQFNSTQLNSTQLN